MRPYVRLPTRYVELLCDIPRLAYGSCGVNYGERRTLVGTASVEVLKGGRGSLTNLLPPFKKKVGRLYRNLR